MDYFFETIVKHQKTGKEYLKELGFFVGGILGAIVIFILTALMRLHVIGVAGSMACLFFALRAIVFHKWEYEYTVTAGSVDIDKIIAQRKRQRMISFDCRDCEIIAPMHCGDYFSAYSDLPQKDFTAYKEHPANYFAVLERSGMRTCILFQPTEDMVHAFRKYNPQKVFIE